MIKRLAVRWIIISTILLFLVALILVDMVRSAKPFSDEDKGVVSHALSPLGIDATTVKWKWLIGWRERWGLEHGLCASYRCLSNTVVVIPEYRFVLAEPVMLPTYAHELRHAKQRQRMGLFAYIWIKTFHRNLLEDEAIAEELRVLDLVTRPVHAAE